MIYQKAQATVRKVFPASIASTIRSLATGVLTPLHFSYNRGHFKSSLMRKAVDIHGDPIPWYTYPMVDFLSAKELSHCAILEFGAGQSTFWWAKRVQVVTSCEADPEWFAYVKRTVPSNVNLHLLPNDLVGLSEKLGDQKYDIVIIDGLDRAQAAEKSADLIKPMGGIIVDNAEGYWGPEGTYPIMDLFRTNEFSRIDFYGHAPGVILPHCTSLFFKDNCFLLTGQENPVRG